MPQLPGTIKVNSVLGGLVLVRRIRAEDDHAVFDPETRSVRSESLGDGSLMVCASDCQGMTVAEQRDYLRTYLTEIGLVGA